MKRVLLVALLAACSPSFEQTDAGGAVVASLELDDNALVVVRGQSATLHVSLFEQQGTAPLHLSLGTLPAGITSNDVDWQPSQGNVVALTVTAASDAPDAELPFTLTATANGVIAGSQSGTLSISEMAGSPDPSFGQNGVTSLGQVGFDAKIVGIHEQTNGAWMLAGYDASGGPQVFPVLIRVLANGALDPSFGEGGVRQLSFPQGLGITELPSVAFAPDDRMVLGIVRGTDGTVATVGADGIVTGESPAAGPPAALAWDGTDLFVATGSEIDHGSSSTPAPFALAAMHSSGAGSVIAYGRGPTGVARFVANGSGITADATYGNAGFLGLPASGTTLAPAPFDVDAQGRALVGLDTLQIARVDPNGALNPTWGQGGLASLAGASGTAPVWVHALASAGAIVIGADGTQNLLVMLDASGSAVPFGTYGRTLLCANCTLEAAAVDASETRVCVAEESTTTGLLLACYRLAP